MMNKSEQWLLDGTCHICRRKDYCSKPCKACKNRENSEMAHAVARAMARCMTGK